MTVKPEREIRIIWYMSTLIIFAVSLLVILAFFLFSDASIWPLIGFAAAWLLCLIIALIWVPAAYNALEYYIEPDSVRMKGGVFWRKHVTVPNRKITNIDITQGPFERFLKIGTVHVQTAGAGGQQGHKAELKISGVKEMAAIRDAINNNIISDSATAQGRAADGKVLPASAAISAAEQLNVSPEKEILLEILSTLKSIDERLKR